MAIEVSSWTELDGIRSDLEADYVLTDDLTPEDDDYSNINRATESPYRVDHEKESGDWNSGDVVELHFDEDKYSSILEVGTTGGATINFSENDDNTITLENNLGDNVLRVEYENAVVGHDPIGASEPYFTGTFDGQGHTIEGLYIDRPNEQDIGLFGLVYETSIISNLDLVGVDITGKYGIGGIAGGSNYDARIENVTVEGTLQDFSKSSGGGQPLGGIIGYVNGNGDGNLIYECTTDVDIVGEGPCGGVVGFLEGGKVQKCSSRGSVIAEDGDVGIAGGLVGNLSNDPSYSPAIPGEIIDCYSKSQVEGTIISGGLVGIAQTSTIGYSYATGSVADTTFSGMTTSGSLVGIVGDDNQSETKTLTLNGGYADYESTGQTNLYNLMDGGLGVVETTSSEGTTLTTEEMKGDTAQANMGELTFYEGPWDMVTGDYPVLNYEEVEAGVPQEVIERLRAGNRRKDMFMGGAGSGGEVEESTVVEGVSEGEGRRFTLPDVVPPVAVGGGRIPPAVPDYAPGDTMKTITGVPSVSREGIAVDNKDSIWTTTSGTEFHEMTKDGSIIRTPSFEGSLGRMGIDSNGSIFLADLTLGGTLRVFDQSPSYLVSLKTPNAHSNYDVSGVGVDENDSLWVMETDYGGFWVVSKITPYGGSVISSFEGPFTTCVNELGGLTVEDGGNIWVADGFNERMVEMDRTGSVISSFSLPSGIHNHIKDVTIDGDGIWFVNLPSTYEEIKKVST